MRLATIIEGGQPVVAIVRGERLLPLTTEGLGPTSMRAIAASGPDGLDRIGEWAERQPEVAYRSADEVGLGPAVPDPGAIYTVGLNYRAPGAVDATRPERPLIYGKAASAVAAHGSRLSWDRSLTANVDPEVELGVVIGGGGGVFGYTIINDISSRDPWLDGDQWLMGKSMPGFCPVGPVIVTSDELDPVGLRLGTTIDGAAIQDGSTDQMLFGIDEIIRYLSMHVELRPGDLIATGTPPRQVGPPGPDRHLESGDTVITWIDSIGSLMTVID
jgi:2-keto-4-pentenoate hydratase/2-oxohepta-3-ene-1,7-dioic acid hydratase in catechol pathway